MVLAVSTRHFKYEPVVSTTEFEIPFPIYAAEDIAVYVDGELLSSGYTVSGKFDNGVSTDAVVVLTTGVTGVDVELFGDRAARREENYLGNSPNLATNLQADLDRITAVQQEHGRELDRTIRAGVDEGFEVEAGDDEQFLQWSGGKLVNVDLGNSASGGDAGLVKNILRSHTGDGTTVDFAIGQAVTSAVHVLVNWEGRTVLSSEYALHPTDNSILRFNEAPPDGSSFEIRSHAPLSSDISMLADLGTSGPWDDAEEALAARPISFNTHADIVAFSQTAYGLSLVDGSIISKGDEEYVREEDADVIPAMPGWRPKGNTASFEMFGAVGDAVLDEDHALVSYTDDEDAIEAAIDWMRNDSSRELVGTKGKVYGMATGIYKECLNFRLRMNGARVVRDSEGVVFNIFAPLYGPYQLASDYVHGSTTISLADEAERVLKSGQIAKIIDFGALDPYEEDRGSEDASARVAEFFFVGDDGTTTSLTLLSELEFKTGIDETSAVGEEATVATYTSAKSYVLYADPDAEFDVSGLITNSEGGHEDDLWNSNVVRFTGFMKGRIDNSGCERGYGSGLRLKGCYGARITNYSSKNLPNDIGNQILGYGVLMSGCAGCVVDGMLSVRSRHAYTSGNAYTDETDPLLVNMIAAGRNIDNLIVRGNSHASVAGHWDTHHQSHREMFRDCIASGGDSWALSVRGIDVTHDNLTATNTAYGAQFFTENDSSQPDDDEFVNAKEVWAFSNGEVRNSRITCRAIPIQCKYATGIVRDIAVTTEDHCGVYVLGGVQHIYGNVSITSIAGDVSGDHSRTGMITLQLASASAQDVFPSTELYIHGKLTLDARNASAGTVHAFSLEADSGAYQCKVIVDGGTLEMFLPAGATYLDGPNNITCINGGKIIVSVEGADDNTIFTDSGDLTNQTVETVDGTAFWVDAPSDRRDLSLTYYDYDVDITSTGTGSEVQNVLVPGGQEGLFDMNTRGAGVIRMKLTGTKTGSTASATIRIRNGDSNFVQSFDLPSSGGVHWKLDSSMSVTGTDAQYYESSWYEETGANNKVENNTESETLSDRDERAFRISVEATSPDAVVIESVEIWATSGGIL